MWQLFDESTLPTKDKNLSQISQQWHTNSERLIPLGKVSYGNVMPKAYSCGFCNTLVTSDRGLANLNMNGYVYFCSGCNRPTFFQGDSQSPGPKVGRDISNLPQEVSLAYNESRVSFGSGNFTSCVMMCRKILMNLSVEDGAEEGKTFVEYLNYMEKKDIITKRIKPWVDKIRKLGNDANHKVDPMSQEQAVDILNFTEVLLQLHYEFPSKI